MEKSWLRRFGGNSLWPIMVWHFANLGLFVEGVTQPLALIVSARATQSRILEENLGQLGYRVEVVPGAAAMLAVARNEKPLALFADLAQNQDDMLAAIQQLHSDPALQHIPVVAFGESDDKELAAKALQAGARMTVNDRAVQVHLRQLLEQALSVE